MKSGQKIIGMILRSFYTRNPKQNTQYIQLYEYSIDNLSTVGPNLYYSANMFNMLSNIYVPVSVILTVHVAVFPARSVAV